jgi:hypothetical protein
MEPVGKICHLNKPVRNHEGIMKFKEPATILRVVNNLDRTMYLVKFEDLSTTFLFPDEVSIIE